LSARARLRADLGASLAGPGGPLSAANRLCLKCVELLKVDGAAISLMYGGTTKGTFGSSGELSRQLDEMQFTYGEGPCLDAFRGGSPVLLSDVDDERDQRWPAFTRAAAASGVHSVFALPVRVARSPIGALDLFSSRPGPLSGDELDGGMWAAELAALPLLDLMTADTDWVAAGEGGDGWEQLASLERVEVYQATGMIIAQLDVDATEALVRLRAYAFAEGLTASEAAWAIVERRVVLDADEPGPGGREGNDRRGGDGGTR
jgi:GAF domain